MLTYNKAFGGFSVNNLAAAKKFYSEILGIKVKETPMGLQLPISKDTPIFIYEKADHAPATFTILNFQVDDIDEAVDELQSEGVIFERYENFPQDEKAIMRGIKANRGPDIAWFKDPAGNILSVLQEK